jgi:hypothetical protein
MSDPIDAKFLREMVQELSSEEPKPIDWDQVEERLLSRLEAEGAPAVTPDYLAGPLFADDDLGDEIVGEEGHGDDAHVVGAADSGTGMGPERVVARGELDDAEAGGSEAITEGARGPTAASTTRRGREAGSEDRSSTERVSVDRISVDRLSLPYVAATAAYGLGQADHREANRAILHVPALGTAKRGSGADLDDGFDLGDRFDDGPRSPRRAVSDLGRSGSEGARLRRWGAVGVMVAAAACFAFVLGGLLTGGLATGGRSAKGGSDTQIVAERWVDPADVPMAPGMSGAHDLGALRAGDMVEATSGAVSFGRVSSGQPGPSGQAQNVSWTLAPGSRVFVRSAAGDSRQVLVLESGSIRADVSGAPQGVVDPFVIEAGDTRVAVSDTLFSVTRSSQGLMVDVERGLVVVGPRDEVGLGSGRVLRASESGVFSLDGGRTFRAKTPERTAALSMVAPPIDPTRARHDGALKVDGSNDAASGNAPAEGPQPAPVGDREGPKGPRKNPPASEGSSSGASAAKADEGSASPTAAAPVLDEGTIRGSLEGCFARVEAQHRADAGKDDGVALTMRSTLRLKVADDGAIRAASFNPPLRPDLQACAVSLLSGHVQGGARTLDIPVEIRH